MSKGIKQNICEAYKRPIFKKKGKKKNEKEGRQERDQKN
jgi:hypothetical protein